MREVIWLDLRSSREFLHSHIPKALNFPVLNNEEYEEIGTLYRKNAFEAKKRGSAYICKNIASFLQNEEIFHPKNKLILYCARGGQRSKSFWSVLKEIGFDCERIEGGYKAYRAQVLNTLNQKPKQQFITLYGLTGCGKTELIQMASEWSIDLENLSKHYGSSFGDEANAFMGQPSNAMFENELYEELQHKGGVLLIEGESKKLGNIIIPHHFFHSFHLGKKILICASLQERVKRIVRMYARIKRENFYTSIEKIKPYIQKTFFQEAIKSWEERDFHKTALILLEKYYDRVYRQKECDITICTDDLLKAHKTLCEIKEEMSLQI